MYYIKTINEISQVGLDKLTKDNFHVTAEEQAPHGILVRSSTITSENFNPNLHVVARAGTNTTTIDIDACTEQGIVVFNTPGSNANAVKELVLAGLILASRNIFGGIAWAQSLVGKVGIAKIIDQSDSPFVGPEIAGKILGVIGLGSSGVLVANSARELGMRVWGYDPYISVDAAWHLSQGVRRAPALDALLAVADYISVHVPATLQTKHMFDENTFRKCKPGVRMLNFSRAEVVNNDAIKAAISNGMVASYVTDFPSEDILGNEKIITIPNLGAVTPEARANSATMAATQLKDYLLYGNIKHSVNFPDCEIPHIAAQKRVCIIHRNVAKVVGPITGVFSDRSLNIYNMLNRSNGEFAYTMLDVDNVSLDGIENELLKIANIVKVRVI
ncbi:MAG: 3-phosphoglycerate dehydrogenase family protein [Defluviitaleaceae bacterium]|nr:3-phosphoglycerate dehydrogenase family protein [Defluviitaleaceae bacterium]